MKAWIVSGDPDTDIGACVVHADTRGRAVSAAIVKLEGDQNDRLDYSAKRAPTWDDQPLPTDRELYEEHGWYFTCPCSARMSKEDETDAAHPPPVWVAGAAGAGERIQCAACYAVDQGKKVKSA